MPIINWISIYNVHGKTDEDLTLMAKEKMDKVADLQVIMNGTYLNTNGVDLSSSTMPFEIILPENNVLGLDPGPRRAVSDGFWVFLKPLERESTSLVHLGHVLPVPPRLVLIIK